MSRRGDPGTLHREEKHLFKHLKHIDLVVEVLDARLPLTSRNYRLEQGFSSKKRLILLNKSDLADKEITGQWLVYLARESRPVLAFSCKGLADLKRFETALLQLRPPQLKFKRPLRLMVAGIPNVGKSSIINRLAHRLAARTGDTPGLTRGAQWIRLRVGWDLLDTPGLLSPHINPDRLSPGLVVIGAVQARGYDMEEAAMWLLGRIQQNERYRAAFLRFYRLKELREDVLPDVYLENIAFSRGLLAPGGEPSKERAAQVLLRDFRKGALGRITLESPVDVDG